MSDIPDEGYDEMTMGLMAAEIARLTTERDEWIQRADRAEARFAAARVALKWDEGRMASERAAYQANLAAVRTMLEKVDTWLLTRPAGIHWASHSLHDEIVVMLSRPGTGENDEGHLVETQTILDDWRREDREAEIARLTTERDDARREANELRVSHDTWVLLDAIDAGGEARAARAERDEWKREAESLKWRSLKWQQRALSAEGDLAAVTAENYGDLLDQMDEVWGNAQEIGRSEIRAFLESRRVHTPTTRLREQVVALHIDRAALRKALKAAQTEIRSLSSSFVAGWPSRRVAKQIDDALTHFGTGEEK